jgi:hypothetical protein
VASGSLYYLFGSDLNEDGSPDLAAWGSVCNAGCSETHPAALVLLNRGDGTLENPVGYPMPFSGISQFLAMDMNGDGSPELAVTTVTCDMGGLHPLGGPTASCAALLANRGDGTFENSVSYDLGPPVSALFTDLDGDTRVDLAFLSPFAVKVLWNRTPPPLSIDTNHNGIPDECEVPFHRGDPNSSGETDISDGIAIFGFLFLGNPATLPCKESADANNDGRIDISDGIFLLSWLFTGGPQPAAPGPSGMPCGVDPDPPGSPGDLGCNEYAACH